MGGELDGGAIRDRLVERGGALFGKPGGFVDLARVREADALLNDLAGHPHAFVLACIMDRQIRAERAWVIPYRIAEALGGFDIARLGALSCEDVQRLMREPEALHRMPDLMGRLFHAGVRRIIEVYGGDAARIWRDRPTSAAVIFRFLEFDGVGPKIATMAANILAREFKIPFADHFSIDISADVQVRRVFGRLGLCRADATVDEVIYKARALHPAFPGIMDLVCWEIGRTWCRPATPDCGCCPMGDLCPTARRGVAAIDVARVVAAVGAEGEGDRGKVGDLERR